jgi:carbamoyl-phosphate synthase small subunit
VDKKAFLVLEDGSIYEGYSFGTATSAYGEVVFNTSMVGYQEMLTDPSYAGQILVPTYPLIGNYGINEVDFESSRIQVSGLVVRENCLQPSHWQSTKTLHQFLVEYQVPGIYDIDTRALTRRLRSAGVMMGIITFEESREEALARLKELPRYDNSDFIPKVTTSSPYQFPIEEENSTSTPETHLVVIDCGVKFSILRSLARLGCQLTVVPATFSAEEILNLKPDGIVISPGPGNPAQLNYLMKTVRDLLVKKPMMGICLGHHLIAQAFEAQTFKLKFGHRGGNHPVKDLRNGRVYITTQNHGYAVDANSLKGGLEITHINLNDGTIEGIGHQELPILSIQYHSEASPGPEGNFYLFEEFLKMVEGG